MFASLPLNALRAFESAARQQSFKAAAAELAVTPTAISHQIRTLETWLGVRLFERLPRRVLLSEDGRRLFPRLHGALLDISQGVDSLRPQPNPGQLTISTTPAFAALWLIPRLGRFYAAQPQIKLRLDASCAPIDLQQDASVDLVIRYCQAHSASLSGMRLFDESFAVYGSPAQVASAGQRAPSLISVYWQDSALYAQGWQTWCEQAGEDWLRQGPAILEYEDEQHALQAAIAGQGLVLASSILVSDALASGLLQPYRPQIRVPGAGYSALCVPGRERHPPLRAFLDWLLGEAASAPAHATRSPPDEKSPSPQG